MCICVTLVERNGRVVSAVFFKEEISVGRSSSNDICPDPLIYNQVSRKHGRAFAKDGEWFYEDLGSTQGSYHDGRELKEPLKLQRGDVIVLGRDGPSVNFTWSVRRVTGQAGTHIRQRLRSSSAFPLAFSDSFRQRFQRYEKIASGGFGEVWKGVPINPEEPPLAIKLMHPQLLDPDNLATHDRLSLISRFSREAKITHQLSRAADGVIPRVHSWGDDADRDYLYIVMDMIEGVTFDQLIYPRQPLPIEQVGAYMYRVAQGLDVAHTFEFLDDRGQRVRGVVHRDVKPNNIIIENGTKKAWIVDFGVAGFQEGGERLTSTNITVGTFQFLPLESIERSVVTTATDLWGFTVTMYLALTGGRFPYQCGEKMDIIKALRSGQVTPIASHRFDLPPELEQAIDRSLSIDPGVRVQSAREWMKVLEPWAKKDKS